MMNRRSFLVGACCALHAWPAEAHRRRPSALRFFCSTPNVEDSVSSEQAAPTINGFPMLGASYKPGTLWRFDQGATPNTGKITLNVKFVHGRGYGTRRQRAMVQRYAQDWTRNTPLGKVLAFNFDQRAEVSHVRVALGLTPGDNESLVGTEAIAPTAKPDQSTMKIGDIRADVIRHEFGHVLGLRHEHQNPHARIPWNRDAVYDILGASPYNWSREKIDSNLLHVYRGSACPGQSTWDPHSIMMYQLWPEFLDSSLSTDSLLYRELTGGNKLISRRDRECVERLYGVRA
jgi:hypothetical protein